MIGRIQVLGTGCARCDSLVTNARAAAGELGVEATVEKISDMDEILAFGVPLQAAAAVFGIVLWATSHFI